LPYVTRVPAKAPQHRCCSLGSKRRASLPGENLRTDFSNAVGADGNELPQAIPVRGRPNSCFARSSSALEELGICLNGNPMNINLLILQPISYIHSLCFLDTARYLRHHLRKHGIEALIGKNRPEPDMLNIIFGAHLGFPQQWINDFQCIIFNQEQIGINGSVLPSDYISLLKNTHTIDYDRANLPGYTNINESKTDEHLRLVLPLRHAPYLESIGKILPIDERPIDLLFFGSLNQERSRLIRRIEQSGIEVAVFDHPIYGPERDDYVSQAKAVLNTPFYETNRFEQVRAFSALSIGTPVVSLRRPGLHVDPVYAQSIHWFEDAHLESYFSQQFGSPKWVNDSMTQLAHWRMWNAESSIGALAEALKEMHASTSRHSQSNQSRIAKRLNLAGDRMYRPAWINVSRENSETADSQLDLNDSPFEGGSITFTSATGKINIIPGSIEEIYAIHDFMYGSTIPKVLLRNAIALLKTGGTLTLDCSLGIYGGDEPILNTTQQQALAQMRLTLDDCITRGTHQNTLEIQEVQSIQEPAASGQGMRCSLRVRLSARLLTPREAVARRCSSLNFGSFPEDHLGVTPMADAPLEAST
jgi:hypothetical protein